MLESYALECRHISTFLSVTGSQMKMYGCVKGSFDSFTSAVE